MTTLVGTVKMHTMKVKATVAVHATYCVEIDVDDSMSIEEKQELILKAADKMVETNGFSNDNYVIEDCDDLGLIN